jgi:hypothetical protein
MDGQVSFPDEGAGFPSLDSWAFPLRGLLLCLSHNRRPFFFLPFFFISPAWELVLLRSTLGRKSTIDERRVRLSAELPESYVLHHGTAPNDWKWCI